MDNSTLRATARCTTEAATRYALMLGPIGEGLPLLAGRAVHATLDWWFTVGAKPEHVGKAVGFVYKTYAEAGELSIDDERLTPTNVARIVEKWMRTVGPTLPWSVTGTHVEFEAQIEAPLSDDVMFVALLDGIVRNRADGLWYVLEHKTTRTLSSYWLAQWTTAAQVTGYVWAGTQHLRALGEVNPKIVGAFINAIEIQTEPKKMEMKCRTHGVKYGECKDQHNKSEVKVVSRSPQMIAQWRETALVLAEKFRGIKARYTTLADVANHAPQEGRFHGACQFCSFRQWCDVGRPLGVTMLQPAPWAPIDGEDA